MVFNKFSIQVFIRLVLISLTMFGAIWSYFETNIYMSPIGFGLLTLAQVGLLLYFINKTRHDLLKFFQSFDHRDFNKSYSEYQWDGSQDELKAAFNNVLKTFKTLSLEREEQYQYLKLVNQHVSVGLISFKSNGRIDLMNKAACHLLNVPLLGRIDQLANHDEAIWQQIQALKVGEQSILIPSEGSGKLAVVSKEFKLADEAYTLVSFQDISAELEEGEMDAWQKLIRVLTHEIMNSVTPVVSLTTAVKMIMQDEAGKLKTSALPQDDLEDIFKSIVAIERRGKGLLGFVKAYRDYTRPPVPEMGEVNLRNWLHDTVQVVKTEMKDLGINISTDISEDIVLQADEQLISQVLINLLKNAKEAMEGQKDGRIDIGIQKSEDHLKLTISDNGPGIPEDMLKDIFIPFFTTKKNGNGIGLSLSKQIMKAHKGDITVESGLAGTTVGLNFY